MSANSVLPPWVVTILPLRIEYFAGTTRKLASVCQSRLPSAAMRFLFSRALMRPSLSRLETSANTTGSRSSESRAPELAPSSNGPKLRVKASCWASVMSWPGSTSTACLSMPALTAATSSGVSGWRASMPVIRPPICSVSGVTLMAIVSSWARMMRHDRDSLNKQALSQSGRDIAAVDGQHRAGGLGRLGQRHEALRHVVGDDLEAQQVAAHVIGFAQPARLGALGDHLVGQQPRADAVGVHRVGADAVGAMIERVLAHEEERRGLGQPVGAEVGSRVHRLLGRVEQQAATQPLRLHEAHGILRHALVRPEVELEALAQGRLVDLADLALPRRTRVRYDDVDTAIGRRGLVEGGADLGGIGDVACHGEAFDLGDVAIDDHDLRTFFGEGRSGGGADARGTAGHDDDAARQRLLGRGAELGLLERPVFDVENVRLGDALVAGGPVGSGDLRDRGLGEVGSDLGVLRAVA